MISQVRIHVGTCMPDGTELLPDLSSRRFRYTQLNVLSVAAMSLLRIINRKIVLKIIFGTQLIFQGKRIQLSYRQLQKQDYRMQSDIFQYNDVVLTGRECPLHRLQGRLLLSRDYFTSEYGFSNETYPGSLWKSESGKPTFGWHHNAKFNVTSPVILHFWKYFSKQEHKCRFTCIRSACPHPTSTSTFPTLTSKIGRPGNPVCVGNTDDRSLEFETTEFTKSV